MNRTGGWLITVAGMLLALWGMIIAAIISCPDSLPFTFVCVALVGVGMIGTGLILSGMGVLE